MGDCLIADQCRVFARTVPIISGLSIVVGRHIDLSTLPNYAQQAADAGLGVPPPTLASSLPLSLPAQFLPKGTVASPTGLQTAIVCPAGFTAVGGVCSPNTPAPTTTGIPTWAIYGGIGLMFMMVMMSAGGGRR